MGCHRRLFFGLDIELTNSNHIADWLSNAVSASKIPTKQSNWHLTLAFLPEVTEQQADRLIDFAESLSERAFTLTFEDIGFWQHNGIFYLKPAHQPNALISLAESLRQFGSELDIYHNPYPFSPHITLFRGLKKPPQIKAPISPFQQSVTRYHLYWSHRTEKDGLIYEPIRTFSLLP